MSETYYLWTSYKGIVNKIPGQSSGAPYGSLVKKWIEFLYRGEGKGNQNYYIGKIGNTTYDYMQVFGDDYIGHGTVPDGRMGIRLYKSGDADPQNLARVGFTWRVGETGFNDKDGLTQSEINNFYGDFAISRGFNRSYSIKTSVEYVSGSNPEDSKQATVSLNNDGNYVNVDDGEWKLRFTRADENPFEGIGCLFGFMTWPFKEPIYYPYTPNKTSTDFVLICYFDEDVTDLDVSHFSLTNCTITEARKITAKEYWVIFQINEPATGEWTTEYTISLLKDKVTAVNDTNKKNRTHSITYTCIQNNGKLVVYNKSGDDQVSTDYGVTFQNDSATDFELDKAGLYASEFVGYKFIAQPGDEMWESINGINWTLMRGGQAHVFDSTDYEKASGDKKMVKLVSGKDGSGNNLLIALTEDKKIYYCRDGGYNWFKYDGVIDSKEKVYGFSGLGQPHGMNILGLTYAKGTWIICGENSKIMYSTDGYNFTDTGVDIDDVIFREVIYHKDRFIIVGKKTDHTGYSGYSTDGGINWTMNSSHFPGINSGGNSYYGGENMGPFLLATDNSGTVITVSEHNNKESSRKNIWYSNDSGITWTAVTFSQELYDTSDHYRRCTTCIWNGKRFLVVWRNYAWTTYFASSTDGINWTTINTGYGGGGYGFSRWMFSNYYNSGETPYSDVDGILNVTVGELMQITDISQNYFPANLVPQAWWENMLSNPLDIEKRKKENDTRRNYLFKKIFEANQTITYFDISKNVINMPVNSIKDSVRVFKKINNSFDINLNTNTDIDENLGYYVILENVDDKVNFTNTANDISFNLVRVGTDENGYATYNIEKTGGTNNLIIDF